MTRDEALRKFDESTGWFSHNPIDVLHMARAEFVKYINEVESRSCENCKYYTKCEDNFNYCDKNSLLNGFINDEFGCNKWSER